ncbi:MAG: hypothetical protein AAGF49_02495 [Pseudomonadota bacterium]
MRKAILMACLAPLALGAFASSSENAEARTVCKQRSEIIKILSNKFKETQRSYGLQNDRRVLELYASPNGSWTAILTMPSGQSCVVASGEAWTTLPALPVGEPA